MARFFRFALPGLLIGPVLGGASCLILKGLTPACAGETDDPWAACFRKAGFEARPLSVSHAPSRHFAVVDRRGAFEDPPWSETVLQDLEVGGSRVQIAEFPSEARAAEMFESRTPQVIAKTPGSRLHYDVQRVGRFVAVVRPVQELFRRRNVEERLAAHILRVFAERAGTLP
ncbi:MAG: hypothetical protein HYY16_10650 [Planctomycetes bacterium]|nr:hypothetical protein [Planctomycetota bacterium]